MAERILEEVREPFRTEGLEIIISASIGVAMSKDRDGSLEDLVEAADRAASTKPRCWARAAMSSPPPAMLHPRLPEI